MKKIFLILIFLSQYLFSHPHFFIDASINIEKEKTIYIWRFDTINSKLLTFDFDKNRNKRFDINEQTNFLKAHFYNLKKDNYNIFFETGEKERIIVPKNIKVELIKRRVVVSFESIGVLKGISTICTIDPTLYMAFKLKNIKTPFKTDVQKSEHDYCIGVTK